MTNPSPQGGGSPTPLEQQARELAKRIYRDLNDRQGIKHELRACREDIQQEIRDAHASIILKGMKRVRDEGAEDTKRLDAAYWRGYKARIDESTAEQPEPKNPTLWRYLQSAFEKQITFHSIGVNRRPDGGFHFYIHPQSVSGDTEDYLVWPDPFNWHDMIVNMKDSPAPDLEKFKAFLSKAIAERPSPEKESP